MSVPYASSDWEPGLAGHPISDQLTLPLISSRSFLARPFSVRAFLPQLSSGQPFLLSSGEPLLPSSAQARRSMPKWSVGPNSWAQQSGNPLSTQKQRDIHWVTDRVAIADGA